MSRIERLLSRSPATHRISHAEKKRKNDLGRSGRRDDREFTDLVFKTREPWLSFTYKLTQQKV